MDEDELDGGSEDEEGGSSRELRAQRRARERKLNESKGEIPALKRKIKQLERELREEHGRKKPKNTVLDTPPSSIDEGKFELIHPLITIMKGYMPAYNHIEIKGDSNVFQKAGQYILTEISQFVDSYGGTDEPNEEEERQFMTLLLAYLHDFSEPEKDLLVTPESVAYEESPDNQYSDSSEEDLKTRINQSEPNSKKSWRMDIACSTIKRKIKQVISESPRCSKLDELKWFVKLVIECKKETIKGRDMFQALMYAILKITERFNLSLPIDPVYAQVWTPLRWCCALLDIKGFVLVKNGKIEPTSLIRYKEELVARKKRRGNKEESRSELEPEQLGMKLTAMEDELIKRHGCRYRNGWYPVGVAYIDKRERDFPNLHAGSASVEKEDVKCFFQVLMRTLLGNKWLKRSSSDLLEVMMQRQTLRWMKYPPQDASFMEAVLKVRKNTMKSVLENADEQNW